MSMHRNKELRTAIEKCLADLGAHSIQFGSGGKHQFVDFVVDGLILRHSFTTTPSDHRYIQNTVRDLKRHVREHLDRRAKKA